MNLQNANWNATQQSTLEKASVSCLIWESQSMGESQAPALLIHLEDWQCVHASCSLSFQVWALRITKDLCLEVYVPVFHNDHLFPTEVLHLLASSEE